MAFMDQERLERLIQKRRTPNPVMFTNQAVDTDLLKRAMDVARYAPNHKRTEPVRYYLCNADQKKALGALFEEVLLQKKGEEAAELAAKKREIWTSVPALVVVTNLSPRHSKVAQNRAEIHQEDYATVATVIQNLSLLLFNQGIHTKWSTAAVKDDTSVYDIIGCEHRPPDEEIAGFLLMGYLPEETEFTLRKMLPLDAILKS